MTLAAVHPRARLGIRSAVLWLLSILLWSLPASAQPRPGLQANSGRDCAVCHLEWSDSFTRPGAAPLLDAPAKPLVAESETCLGCHDGSVSDSRREVWLEHSHKTGVAPSQGMSVPRNLPLSDGTLSCRTCHTAHTQAGAGAVESPLPMAGLRDHVFLRVPNDSGQLCIACHKEQSKGPEAGSHPLTVMKDEKKVPEVLLAVGSHAGAANNQVVCQTCHTAHGSKIDHLLVMPTTSSQLCASCHEAMRPGMWKPDAHEHPQNPALTNAAHVQAIKDMGTKLGDNNTLVCLSCHKVHGGHSGRAMLAETLTDSKLCLRCHGDRAEMAGSPHDLRKTGPNELNRWKQTPHESGYCGSCHTFHSLARPPTPRAGDPQGLCTTCHSQDQVAAKHSGLPLSHPADVPAGRAEKITLTLYPSHMDAGKQTIACLTCHDPHKTASSHFLRKPPDALCASCHAEKSEALAGAHDFTLSQEARNARGKTGAEAGKCGFCHAVHDAPGPKMWVATKDTPKTADELCSSCHKEGSLAGKHPVALLNHPTGSQVTLAKLKPATRPADAPALALPLFDGFAHSAQGGVACSSCHDPHRSEKTSPGMLRAAAPTALCIQCHVDQARMAGGSHDVPKTDKPLPAGMRRQQDLCTSCHKPHSNDPEKGRWAVAPADKVLKGDPVCIACHKASASIDADKATAAGHLMHPTKIPAAHLAEILAAASPNDDPGRPQTHAHVPTHVSPNLNLVASEASGPADTIACKTCHDPHAAPPAPLLLRLPAGAAKADLCTSCHTGARHLEKSMHSEPYLDPQHKTDRACAPCHSAHSQVGTEKKFLWSAKVNEAGTTVEERMCLGCHSTGGGAVAPVIFRHPETAMKQVIAGAAPAAGGPGPATRPANVFPINELTCSTCHVSHGRDMGQAAAPESPAVAKARRSAIKPMLRPDIDRTVCATCHGLDATRVYLYYHNPKKREQVKKLINP